MRTLISFLFILLSLQIQAKDLAKHPAKDPEKCDPVTETILTTSLNFFSKLKNLGGSPPASCSVEKGKTKKTKLDKKKIEKVTLPPLDKVFTENGMNCDQFISGDVGGGYGSWGQAIVNYINQKGKNSVFLQNDLGGMEKGARACPNWKKLNDDQKKHFWVWVMASIAKIESSCKPESRNPNASNGVAVGLLQLEERPSQRQWRGSDCAIKSVREPLDNLRCGLDIMGGLISGKEGEYKSNGEIFGKKSNSYWKHLRQNDGGDISGMIALNPNCKT